MNCPICNNIIRYSEIEEPSEEYRGFHENFYSGVPIDSHEPPFYYKKDEDKKRVEDEYFNKQKKNFPGNKQTYPQLETPEDMPAIARKKSDNFIYAKCKKCGYKIIKFAVQPDIRQDNDIVDHENNPTDPNVPANQSKVMGDDYDRIESATDNNQTNKKYRKNNNGVIFNTEGVTNETEQV